MGPFKINYVEVMVNTKCNYGCNKNDCIDYMPKKYNRWENVKESVNKWSKIIEFTNFGISGGEPLLNLELDAWISGLREVLPKSNLILITDGRMLRELSDVVKQMIQIAPSKLCVVLNEDWDFIFQEVSAVLTRSGYRFIKQSLLDPDAGIKFIMMDKDKKFDVELYRHAPITIRNPKSINLEFPLLNPKLFRICEMRKSTPLLTDERIFKCRNSARLWYSLNEIAKDQELGTGVSLTALHLNDSSIHYSDDWQKIEGFLRDIEEETKVCQFCQGCIECVVHRKV